ncbi:MAG: hypothetical protein A2W61_04310 [Deltaproteobacteria bacterium RIFCSPLOWO2_01_44_7]|nr:MAG: hypothetical protein A2712_03445 [Deltaproteobacteria bacterium RIFCSPHIGHO2_01_FULL_43_49]OGQ16247.1 MAG: hypothetical protein A3D22_01415 [Deltaproteobacteria bacterium RIFCSPHIGHO2_02_FULL_44_53]OGQ29207.1 MAG: hypothetical protein A3D98_05200 [Deltaproteobacteria bacterium RIFCSPHIGHO2_12_FULL_44_21]OGQ32764.1 MAG: hypothetical protein A2979_09345 [Deltaproteobacteria bacterium RIFCSPLOWO2_01_FULL_45_74]OGQ41866.1 MAG: hypothetical protein A3I70_09130 [Deltaproteobacteria bacterium 
MDFLKLSGFEWDEGNLKKILERIDPHIVEMAFLGEPWVALSQKFSKGEPRWFLINQVENRHVFVVFTIRGNKIRVVSARRMHSKEVKHYEKEFKKKEKTD